MLLIRSQISNILMYITILLWGVLGLPLAIWSRAGAYWVIKGCCASIFWILRLFCNMRIEVRGTVPDKEVLVCSKHMSFLDILILAYHLPKLKFIMKSELRFAPVIGVYAWATKSPAVSRGKRGGAIKKLVADIKADPHRDGQTIIFPQGTRVLPGVKAPYKIGAGVLYSELDIPCVPVATNVGVLWARRSAVRKPGLVILEFLDEIPPGKEMGEFMAEMEETIETNSDRLMREIGFDV